MSDDMGMAEEAMNDAIVESAGYDDEQATAPDEAEALIKKNAKLMNGYLARIAELEARCIYDPETGKIFVPDGHPELERLRSQVAALQEIAIDQLAEQKYDFEYNMDNIGKYFWQRDEKFQKKFFDSARRQLAEEHPEAFR